MRRAPLWENGAGAKIKQIGKKLHMEGSRDARRRCPVGHRPGGRTKQIGKLSHMRGERLRID